VLKGTDWTTARKRAALEKKLVDVAIDLYLERGTAKPGSRHYAAADVSRRTFFYYFAAKERLCRDGLRSRGVSARGISRTASGEPVWDALRRAFGRSIDLRVNEERMQGLRRVIYTELLFMQRSSTGTGGLRRR